MDRRAFLGSLAAIPAAGALLSATQTASRILKPKRLAPGEAVALVAPASATFKPVELDIARESLQALGLTVKVGRSMLARHGYLAGTDQERAADINEFYKDPSVRAVLPIRGGWGSSRVLPYLDFEAIARAPKIILGYSDITALLLSIHARTGCITFHGQERARPDRTPDPDDHPRHRARTAARRQPYRAHGDHRLTLPPAVGRRDPLSRGRR
jgi:muramoyltetrapeptide carboxypeptidase